MKCCFYVGHFDLAVDADVGGDDLARFPVHTVPADDYNFHMDMIHNELGYHALESYEKNLEFTAIHAFLLGLRTGRGLPRE